MLLRIDQVLRLSDTADSLKNFNNESVLQKPLTGKKDKNINSGLFCRQVKTSF